MKRSEIINQLLKEGFTEKTLINFSDKQLQSLSSRITEALTVSQKTLDTDPNAKAKVTAMAKSTDVKIVPEEGMEEGAMPGLKAKKKEVKETGVPGLNAKKSSGDLKHGTTAKEVKESGVPGLNAKKEGKDLKNGTAATEMKESGVPGLNAKKDGKDLKNGTAATEMKESGVPGLNAKKSSGDLKHGTTAKEVKEAAGAMPGLTVKGKSTSTPTKKVEKEEEEIDEKKKPSAGLSAKKKSEVVKKAKAGEDIGKKGKGFEKVVAAAKKGGAKDPEAVAASAMWKNIKRENKSINEWVENVAKKHYHPFTTKNDIMEMIASQMEEVESAEVEVEKLPDFLKFNAIKNSGAAPAPAVPKTTPGTKPGTKPGQNPKPKTPYQPGPGINPSPKAMGESSPKA